MTHASMCLRTENRHTHPTVLVVDDDASNRETLRMLMEELRYPVIDAADRDTTLSILRASAAGMVVVLDVILPRVEDGAAVLQAICADDSLAERHAVVGITASPQMLTPRVHELLDALAAPLVTKPFEIDTLLTCVSAASHRVEAHARWLV